MRHHDSNAHISCTVCKQGQFLKQAQTQAVCPPAVVPALTTTQTFCWHPQCVTPPFTLFHPPSPHFLPTDPVLEEACGGGPPALRPQAHHRAPRRTQEQAGTRRDQCWQRDHGQGGDVRVPTPAEERQHPALTGGCGCVGDGGGGAQFKGGGTDYGLRFAYAWMTGCCQQSLPG